MDDQAETAYPPPSGELTEKQREALTLVGQGLSSKEIALLLGVSPFAIDKRLSTACRILGTSNRRHAARKLASSEIDRPEARLYSREQDCSDELLSRGDSDPGDMATSAGQVGNMAMAGLHDLPKDQPSDAWPNYETFVGAEFAGQKKCGNSESSTYDGLRYQSPHVASQPPGLHSDWAPVETETVLLEDAVNHRHAPWDLTYPDRQAGGLFNAFGETTRRMTIVAALTLAMLAAALIGVSLLQTLSSLLGAV